MKSIKTSHHPAYRWSTLWPLELWVRGLYNYWLFCVLKLSMFIYLSMIITGTVYSTLTNYVFSMSFLDMHNWVITFNFIISNYLNMTKCLIFNSPSLRGMWVYRNFSGGGLTFFSFQRGAPTGNHIIYWFRWG